MPAETAYSQKPWYGTLMSEDNTAWDALSGYVTSARDTEDLRERLEHLRSALDRTNSLINETMAQAVVYGNASLRSVAGVAGFSENTIRPRLASTDLLSGYANGGVISTAEVHRARYDYTSPEGLVDVTAVAGQMTKFDDPAAQQRKPLTFTPRTSKKTPKKEN